MRVKADLTCASVAAASVLAKCERDAMMVELAQQHPAYGWDGNKGYALAEHMAALGEHGPSALHRRALAAARRRELDVADELTLDEVSEGSTARGARGRCSAWGMMVPVSAEDLENYETDMELALYREYRDVVGLFSYVVETERRFYLANQVDLQVRSAAGEVYFELTLGDAWVWDVYRSARFVKSVRVVTFKDVNVEELAKAELDLAAARASGADAPLGVWCPDPPERPPAHCAPSSTAARGNVSVHSGPTRRPLRHARHCANRPAPEVVAWTWTGQPRTQWGGTGKTSPRGCSRRAGWEVLDRNWRTPAASSTSWPSTATSWWSSRSRRARSIGVRAPGGGGHAAQARPAAAAGRRSGWPAHDVHAAVGAGRRRRGPAARRRPAQVEHLVGVV